jgi:hypothetical protein
MRRSIFISPVARVEELAEKIKMKVCFLIGSALLAFGFVVSCQVNPSGENISRPEISPPPHVPSPSDRSEAYVSREGWPIPKVSWDESKVFRIKELPEVKPYKKIQRVKPKTGFFLVLNNPFPGISIGLDAIQLVDATRYDADTKVFAYRFLYSPQNKIGDQSGSVSYFTYYDENGDGNFDTLKFDESGEKGLAIFSATPKVPNWAKE